MNDLPSGPGPSRAWWTAAGRRLAALWLPKTIGISAGMTLFFLGYFLALRHPLRPPSVMPLTFADGWIPFSPASVILYLTLWVYVSLAPGLCAGRRELLAWARAAAGLAVTGLGIFLLFPTAVPPPGETWAADSAYAFLRTIDATGNACPSLHVAFAVLTARVVAQDLRQLGAGASARALNWLWCAGILYSTVATRQHVVLDVVAGAALGALFAPLARVRSGQVSVTAAVAPVAE